MSLPGWRNSGIWVACGHRWRVVDQINIPFFCVFRGHFTSSPINEGMEIKQNLMFHYRNELLFPKMFPKVSTPNTNVNCTSTKSTKSQLPPFTWLTLVVLFLSQETPTFVPTFSTFPKVAWSKSCTLPKVLFAVFSHEEIPRKKRKIKVFCQGHLPKEQEKKLLC